MTKEKEITISRKTYWRLVRASLAFQARSMGGVAGQAFTNFQCVLCEKFDSHPNTNVPLFCSSCEKSCKETVKKLYEENYFNINPFGEAE